jgi:hypothetical protein
MAIKKRAKVAPASPDDRARPDDDEARLESETDIERGTNLDTDVERANSTPPGTRADSGFEGTDSSPSPAPGNVEALDPATPRIDIEHDDGADTGDVERGPP